MLNCLTIRFLPPELQLFLRLFLPLFQRLFLPLELFELMLPTVQRAHQTLVASCHWRFRHLPATSQSPHLPLHAGFQQALKSGRFCHLQWPRLPWLPYRFRFRQSHRPNARHRHQQQAILQVCPPPWLAIKPAF